MYTIEIGKNVDKLNNSLHNNKIWDKRQSYNYLLIQN